MKKLPVFLALFLCSVVKADPLVWDTPIGKIGLPYTATEALVGYGAISKQAIAGASLPVYVSPRDIVAFQVGAVTAWPTNGAAIEPYLALGHDLIKEIPWLKEYKSLHANVFGRYVTNKGKADVGISLSYAFAEY